MLADQADQGHQANLRVNVQRGPAQRQRQQRTADRQRHSHQDDQWVNQAFVLRRQHQVDHHQGSKKRPHQGKALLHILPRFRLPVVAEARRQFGGELFEKGHGVAHRHPRRRDGLQGTGVLLIELQQAVGRHFDL